MDRQVPDPSPDDSRDEDEGRGLSGEHPDFRRDGEGDVVKEFSEDVE